MTAVVAAELPVPLECTAWMRAIAQAGCARTAFAKLHHAQIPLIMDWKETSIVVAFAQSSAVPAGLAIPIQTVNRLFVVVAFVQLQLVSMES